MPTLLINVNVLDRRWPEVNSKTTYVLTEKKSKAEEWFHLMLVLTNLIGSTTIYKPWLKLCRLLQN